MERRWIKKSQETKTIEGGKPAARKRWPLKKPPGFLWKCALVLKIVMWTVPLLAATPSLKPLTYTESRVLISLTSRLKNAEALYQPGSPATLAKVNTQTQAAIAWAVKNGGSGILFKQKILANELAHQFRLFLIGTLGPANPEVARFNRAWLKISVFNGVDLEGFQTRAQRLANALDAYYLSREDLDAPTAQVGLDEAADDGVIATNLNLETEREKVQALLNVVVGNTTLSAQYNLARLNHERAVAYLAGQMALTAGATAVVLGTLYFSAPIVSAAGAAAGLAGTIGAGCAIGAAGGVAAGFILNRYTHLANAFRQSYENGTSYASDFQNEMNHNSGRDFAQLTQAFALGAGAGCGLVGKSMILPLITTKEILYAVSAVSVYSGVNAALDLVHFVEALPPRQVWYTHQALQAMNSAQRAYAENQNAQAKAQLNQALIYAQQAGLDGLKAALTGIVMMKYPGEARVALRETTGKIAKVAAIVAQASDNAGSAAYAMFSSFAQSAHAAQPINSGS